MIRKLRPDPVRHGKHFCIAKIEGGMCTEIEGRYTKGVYTVGLTHQPSYINTYKEYGINATETDWKNAVALLYGQVAQLVANAEQELEKELINQ